MSASAASTAAKTIAKPQLRGHLRDLLTKYLLIIGISSVGSGLAFKYGVAEPRKRRYAEFYRYVDGVDM